MKGFFITGTNTDCGKTVVSAAIFRAMRNMGSKVAISKPVQSGVQTPQDGKTVIPDISVYEQATGCNFSDAELDLISPYRFAPACSPHLAADMAQTTIEISAITDNLKKLGTDHEYVIVEGAGGVLVPLNDHQTMQELMAEAGLPVILVVDNCLGAINHALLSVNSLKQANIKIHGIIYNHTSPITEENRYICEDNIKTIEKFSSCQTLAILPHISRFDGNDQRHWQLLEDELTFLRRL